MIVNYHQIHKIIAGWVSEDKLWPEMKDAISYLAYTDLDEKIVRLCLGRQFHPSTALNNMDVVTDFLRDGSLNMDWIEGSHGLVLFKMWIIQREGILHGS